MSIGDGAGWAGGQSADGRRAQGAKASAAARARRLTARAARERSDQAGVWGRLAPMFKQWPGSSARSGGSPVATLYQPLR